MMSKIKVKILATIVLIVLGIVTVLLATQLFPKQETGTEPEPQPLKDYDAQITGVTFFPDGNGIIVYIENKGNKSFKFRDIGFSLGVAPMTYHTEIFTLYSLEKLNVTFMRSWRPDWACQVNIDVLYEGQEHYTRISYKTRSPSTYPYVFEITNVTFTGVKIYDELGALRYIKNRKMTVAFVNHHDTINLTIAEIRPEENHAIWVSYRLLPKETGNITVHFNWEEGRSYRIFMIAVHEDPTEEQGIAGIVGRIYFSDYHHSSA